MPMATLPPPAHPLRKFPFGGGAESFRGVAYTRTLRPGAQPATRALVDGGGFLDAVAGGQNDVVKPHGAGLRLQDVGDRVRPDSIENRWQGRSPTPEGKSDSERERERERKRRERERDSERERARKREIAPWLPLPPGLPDGPGRL